MTQKSVDYFFIRVLICWHYHVYYP